VPATITFANNGTGTLTSSVSNTNTLPYGLFIDAAHATQVTSTGIAVTGTGVAKVTSVYAQITGAVPADQQTGAYTDTTVVTLTF
jgi:spore coat protein U-like protein